MTEPKLIRNAKEKLLEVVIEARGLSMAYDDKAFFDLIDKYGLDTNSVTLFLQGR